MKPNMPAAIAMPTVIPTVETAVRPGFLIRSRRLSLMSGQEMKDERGRLSAVALAEADA